jgi:hypothetical protein
MRKKKQKTKKKKKQQQLTETCGIKSRGANSPTATRKPGRNISKSQSFWNHWHFWAASAFA